MANRTRAQLSIDASTLFPNNTSQLISPQDLRDWLANGIDSFVTQKDKSALNDVLLESDSTSIVAGATTNLNLADGNFVHITGTTEINSFGDMQAGSRFVLVFDNAAQIRASSAIIIPGVTSGNLKTAIPGDCCMIISEGSGNWRIVGYFPGAGAGSGTVSSVSGTGTVNGITLTGTVTTTGNLTLGGTLSGVDLASQVTGILPIVNGGTGTTTPSLVAGSNVTISGSWPNQTINASGGGGGGSPQGPDGSIQYNDGGSFGGVNDLNWDDVNNVLTINTPRIGQSTGNGHLHMHTINTSPPSGVTSYTTIYSDVSPKQIGARFETDAYTSAFQFGATGDRVYTLPDATGNVLVDTVIPSLNNGTSAGEIRLKEATASGSNYVAIKSPATLGADWSMTLPTSDGTAGTVLQTNGSGVLSWVNNGGAQALQYLKNTTQTTITNPTVNTIVETLTIPAGTFTSNNAFILIAKIASTVTTSAVNYNINLNTSATIGGLNVLASSMSAGNGAQNVALGFNLFGGGSGNTTRYMSNPFTTQSVIGSSTTTIDWSVTQYLVLWVGASATRNVTNVILSVSPI